MDTFARGLRNAVELQQQGVMEKCVQVCRTTYTLHIPQCIVWNRTINLYTVFSLEMGLLMYLFTLFIFWEQDS